MCLEVGRRPGRAARRPHAAGAGPELGWRLARLPRAAVLAAREARLPATLLGRYPEALVQLGITGSRLTPEDLTGYRALGRAAAESGAALPSLVDLYLGVTWRVWDELPDAPGDARPRRRTTAGPRSAVRRSRSCGPRTTRSRPSAPGTRRPAKPSPAPRSRCAASSWTTFSPGRRSPGSCSRGPRRWGCSWRLRTPSSWSAGPPLFARGAGVARAVEARMRELHGARFRRTRRRLPGDHAGSGCW